MLNLAENSSHILSCGNRTIHRLSTPSLKCWGQNCLGFWDICIHFTGWVDLNLKFTMWKLQKCETRAPCWPCDLEHFRLLLCSLCCLIRSRGTALRITNTNKQTKTPWLPQIVQSETDSGPQRVMNLVYYVTEGTQALESWNQFQIPVCHLQAVWALWH